MVESTTVHRPETRDREGEGGRERERERVSPDVWKEGFWSEVTAKAQRAVQEHGT